jgi:hypothetical protein
LLLANALSRDETGRGAVDSYRRRSPGKGAQFPPLFSFRDLEVHVDRVKFPALKSFILQQPIY